MLMPAETGSAVNRRTKRTQKDNGLNHLAKLRGAYQAGNPTMGLAPRAMDDSPIRCSVSCLIGINRH
jgi:hypothetical protein